MLENLHAVGGQPEPEGQSLQARWPEPEADLSLHRQSMLEGVEIIRERLRVPTDGRFEIAYAVQACVPGQEASVHVMGDGGTGKTAFGDMLHGFGHAGGSSS